MPPSKTQARRHEDGDWSWPRLLSFMSVEDIQSFPKEIQDLIYSYLQKS